jgi:hypothetical protein
VKRLVIDRLEALNVPFVDVGLGPDRIDGSLGGILRVTASAPTKRDYVRNGRISFGVSTDDDLCGSDIQVADLNALNAHAGRGQVEEDSRLLPRLGAGTSLHLHDRWKHAHQWGT